MYQKLTRFMLLASLATLNSAFAANPEAGKAASSQCAGCHGPNGISATGAFPNLAGQKADYLAAQLKAFRAKTRVAPIMNGMAGALKDEDIDNLAAYFASLKACQ